MVKKSQADIWYIFHSCFVLKTSNHLLVFDFYKNNPAPSDGPTVVQLLQQNTDVEVVVFSSHGHGDHFNPGIFDWKQHNQGIKYVLSDDISVGKGREDVTLVSPGGSYQLQDISLEVFNSTDLGVSFLVSCEGLNIFHAGDLNWWHWEGEPEDDNEAMAVAYKKEIDKLKGRQIDIAFIPVDPRLEEEYSLGLSYFMETVGAEMVLPMHFGTDYSVFPRLENDLPKGQLERVRMITPVNGRFSFEGTAR